MARLSSLLGALALALACVGIYGLLTQLVVRRHQRNRNSNGPRRGTASGDRNRHARDRAPRDPWCRDWRWRGRMGDADHIQPLVRGHAERSGFTRCGAGLSCRHNASRGVAACAPGGEHLAAPSAQARLIVQPTAAVPVACVHVRVGRQSGSGIQLESTRPFGSQWRGFRVDCTGTWRFSRPAYSDSRSARNCGRPICPPIFRHSAQAASWSDCLVQRKTCSTACISTRAGGSRIGTGGGGLS